MPTASSSTALLLEEDAANLLIDASGGHNILGDLAQAGMAAHTVQQLFISHADSDHILGIVPLFRAFRQDPQKRTRTLYCSREVKQAVITLLETIAPLHYADAKDRLIFDVVSDGDTRRISEWNVTFFSLGSSKTPQMGCALTFADGTKLAFAGDEPLHDEYLKYVSGSDMLIHEAFCTSDQAERFQPYPKHHSTAKDAGQDAFKAHAKQLVLFHMEDETLALRKEAYLRDVQASSFRGKVFVPIDQDKLEF